MKNKTNIPIGVKILSILSYISAVLSLLLGLLCLFGANYLNSLISSSISQELIKQGFETTNMGLFFIIFGIIFIGFAILDFFIARGLWKGQNWARIVQIIFSIFGIFSGFSSLLMGNFSGGIITLIISGVIGGYLLFNREAKKFF